MDEQTIREHAQQHCEALVSGDIGRAAGDMSRELQANMGQIVSMLPLPLTEASVASVEMTGAGYRVVLRLVGEHDTVSLETRWKERDGRPVIVEASHLTDASDPDAAPADPSEGSEA